MYLRRLRRQMSSALEAETRPDIYRVLQLKPRGVVVLQGRCGQTMTSHVHNLAPCHLPNLDPTIRPLLAKPPADLPCEVCRFPDNEAEMLLCDLCNTGWHMGCLKPALTKVPEGDWYCPRCAKTGKMPGPSAARQREDIEAQGYDGRVVSVPVYSRKGAKVVQRFGVLEFKGADARPLYVSMTDRRSLWAWQRLVSIFCRTAPACPRYPLSRRQ